MRFRIYSLIALAAALLAGCSSAPVAPVDVSGREAAARAATARGDYEAASSIYSELIARADGGQQASYQIEYARAQISLGRPEAALTTLDGVASGGGSELNLEVLAARAAANFALARPVEAVRLLVEREIWLETREAIVDNQALIWDGLAVPESAAADQPPTGDAIVDGWLALSPVIRSSDDSPLFLDGLIDWQERFPNHPATTGILSDRFASARSGQRPQRIALLLPLGSDVRPQALAIRDGFLDNHLASASGQRRSIKIYDTAQRGAVESFLTAQIEGADFIVGPLLADEVERVQAQSAFVPTLALNIGRPEASSGASFYQFALSSEDEIEAIAARAIADGNRTAVMLFAASERGNRQKNRFRAAFEALGGRVINEISYLQNSDNMTAPVEEALNISQSNARHQRLTANLGRSIEFEPRRRADIDMIFLQTDPRPDTGPSDARLLVPLLVEYGVDPAVVPTYTTSDIYDPSRADGESDLDGLKFPDLPLLVDPTGRPQSVTSGLLDSSTTSARQNKRFYAFGYDAYSLIDQLYSAAGAGWPLQGATGELYLEANGRIRRVLPFAEFQRGQPAALTPTLGTLGSR